jgi:hypothetical protein
MATNLRSILPIADARSVIYLRSRVLPLLITKPWNVYRTEGLHSTTHPVAAVVLRDMITLRIIQESSASSKMRFFSNFSGSQKTLKST